MPSFPNPEWNALFEQSKYGNAVGRSHKYFPTRNHGRDELVPCAEAVAHASLIAVIEFMRDVHDVEGVQYGRSAVLDSPHNSTGSSIGRDAWRGPRICELHGTLGRR